MESSGFWTASPSSLDFATPRISSQKPPQIREDCPVRSCAGPRNARDYRSSRYSWIVFVTGENSRHKKTNGTSARAATIPQPSVGDGYGVAGFEAPLDVGCADGRELKIATVSRSGQVQRHCRRQTALGFSARSAGSNSLPVKTRTRSLAGQTLIRWPRLRIKVSIQHQLAMPCDPDTMHGYVVRSDVIKHLVERGRIETNFFGQGGGPLRSTASKRSSQRRGYFSYPDQSWFLGPGCSLRPASRNSSPRGRISLVALKRPCLAWAGLFRRPPCFRRSRQPGSRVNAHFPRWFW